MRIRYEFEIDPRQTLDLEPSDFRYCDNLDELHMDLLDQPDPAYRVSINTADLAAFWALVQQAKEPRR